MTKEEKSKYFEKVDSSEYFEKVEVKTEPSKTEETKDSVKTNTNDVIDLKNIKNLKIFKKLANYAIPVGLALTIIGGGCSAIVNHNNSLEIKVSEAERAQYQVQFVDRSEAHTRDRSDLDVLVWEAKAKSINSSVNKKHLWSPYGLSEWEKQQNSVVNMEIMTDENALPEDWYKIYKDFLYTDLKLMEDRRYEYFLINNSNRWYSTADDPRVQESIEDAMASYWRQMDLQRRDMALVRDGVLPFGAKTGLVVGLPLIGLGIYGKINKGNQKVKK